MSVSAFVPMYEEVKWERTTESRISTVISLLPMSLKSRMAPFRPFGRTASMEDLATSKIKDGEELLASHTQLPRPLSVAGPGGLTTASSPALPEMDAGLLQAEHAASAAESTLKASKIRNVLTGGQMATGPGINWRFASQGSSLIQGASEAASEGVNDTFERKAFVDGVTYLIRALPPNLDERELEQVKAALPVSLSLPITESATHPRAMSPPATSGLPRSVLHRSVQLVVVQLILFLHFLLPYLILLFRTVVTFERKFKVSEAVFEQGINLAGAFRRQATRFVDAAVKVNDGKVGQGLSSVVAWIVKEVTRGIADGVGEGMVVTRLRDSTGLAL
ncbi:unnamed protein product [Clonostachys chloroleuca]|uniref:Uncharacterized protein n=1 Tax=Clonostachys chloroleuca TaxID=1926264 RepID=A0AA35M487_9HYPO|nr:unnamed protein product [Clonostachys chloroleuca]